MAGKPRLDPTDLVCDRRSHHAAGIEARILQKKYSASLLTHAGHGFFRHVRRYGRVHLATDYKQRASGSLLTGSVSAEKLVYEPIVLPTRFEHSGRELRPCFSSAGLRDPLVGRKRLFLQHVAYPELRIERFDGRRQSQ